MEIISYVVSGELAHKDSMGNVESIPPGDVQRMSAGTGVMHSEFNHAQGQQTHLLQIWITPNQTGIPPSYEQKTIPKAMKTGTLKLVASPESTAASDSSVKIHADAKMYVGLFDGHQSAKLALDPKRKAYVHLVQGKLTVNGHGIQTGDALMIEQETELLLGQASKAEVIVFDLAPVP
jgi:redox-sensitive bicupin YhaK (pirin superfamily)